MAKSSTNMITDIKRNILQTQDITGKKQLGTQIITAMQKVPREKFVPQEEKLLAYADTPLAIGHGQTISQPFMVALMTDLLDLEADHTVLEIGTGSGYQTAILSQLAYKVFSVEIIEALALSAKQRLQKLHYDNIELHTGNGYEGWPEHAPYDAIIVTAAAAEIPPALIKQLKPGGKMVIPVGHPHQHQELLLLHKNEQNKISTRFILSVAFVPLVKNSNTL